MTPITTPDGALQPVTIGAGAYDIAMDPQVEELLASGAPVVCGVSGGKDSTAAGLALSEYLRQRGASNELVLVHSDLGAIEWAESIEQCRALARHLGVELIETRPSQGGGLMAMIERRWASCVRRYANLETVTLIPPWPSASMRYCTAGAKRDPIAQALCRRLGRQPYINATGVRAEESKKRAGQPVAKVNAKGNVEWRPIHHWSLDRVLAVHDDGGFPLHIGYTQYSMTRISCCFCVLSSLADLQRSMSNPAHAEVARWVFELEVTSTFSFQPSRWLSDLMQLTDEDAARLADAKARAARRQAAERRVPEEMLYVKGWPLRGVTQGEAELLAEVRAEVAAAVDLRVKYLDSMSIQARYDELLEIKGQREERRSRRARR